MLFIGLIDEFEWHNWLDFIMNITIVTILFYWLLRKVELKGLWEQFLSYAFFCYLVFVHVMVTWLYIEQYVTGLEFNISLMQVNLVPFKTLGNLYAITEIPQVYWKQFIGNLLLLTPLGYFVLRLRIVKGAWRAVWFVFLFTVGIECVQFIKSIFILGGRSTDIDDVLLNTVGGLLGVATHFIINKMSVFMKRDQ